MEVGGGGADGRPGDEMRVGCEVAAFVDIALECSRCLIQAKDGEGDDQHHTPVPYSSAVIHRLGQCRKPFHRTYTHDTAECLVIKGLPVRPSGAARSHQAPGRIHFEVEVLFTPGHLHEKLAGAVFPDAALVGKILHPEVESAHTEIHHKGVFGTGGTAGAKRGVRILRRPVDFLNPEYLAISLDGGIQMTIEELGTIMEYGCPVKVIILNNHFLGNVRQWQELFFNRRYSFTHMMNPDYIKIAEAYGVPAQRVKKREELAEAVNKMLATDGPFILEAVVTEEENVLPMTPPGSAISEIMLETE